MDFCNPPRGYSRSWRPPHHELYPLQNIPKKLFNKYHTHNLSEPKRGVNFVKINKSKLPIDFFSKGCNTQKKASSLKLSINDEMPSPTRKYLKAETERLHDSPYRKHCYFMFSEEEDKAYLLRKAQANQLRKNTRNFETRDSYKRYSLHNDLRHYTPANKSAKNDILYLFPPTHDQLTADIIISAKRNITSKIKGYSRKDHLLKCRETQQVLDPEEDEEDTTTGCGYLRGTNVTVGVLPSARDTRIFDEHSDNELLNITFFAGKSISFPPIAYLASRGK